MTFQDQLTALDDKLDFSTNDVLAAKKKDRAKEERKRRLEELEEVEKEQQNILHDMGIDLYDVQDLQNGAITVDLEAQEELARQQAGEERIQNLQKIQQQQTQIRREQEHELGAPASRKETGRSNQEQEHT